MIHDVEFLSEGDTVRGRLFSPAEGRPSPGVVMAPGFSATSRFTMFERHAEEMAKVGVAALLFDYRGFGDSDGTPRLEINGWRQARDCLAGIEFLQGDERIDSYRLGIWGVSSGAAVAAVVAAASADLKAVVLVVPGFGQAISPPDADDSEFESIVNTLLEGDLDAFERTVIGPHPVVSADQLNNPSLVETLTAYRWFIESGGRFDTGWENRATLARLDTPAPFDAQLCVPHITAPTLMVIAHKDEESDADVARHVYANATAQKELVSVDGGHFGVLYPSTAEFERSVSAQTAFLRAHLST